MLTGTLFTQALVFLFVISPIHKNGKPDHLVWADEFVGTAINLNKWNIQTGDGCDISLCGWGNNELEYYTGDPENISVRDGKLFITARKTTEENHPYTSARINTRYKGDWKYGRIEARIRLPEGKGIWPAFWMLPTDWNYGGWPNSGETDIMEMVGDKPSTVHGTIHTGPPHKSYGADFILKTEKFSNSFHVFAIEWNKEGMQWFVDNIKYHSVKSEAVKPWAPFNKRFHVLLNLAVGGNWPGKPDSTTVFPQTLVVDYVRVYQ